MFHNQSEELDKVTTEVLRNAYLQWCEENGKKPNEVKNHYLDNAFFQDVVLQFQKTGGQKEIFCHAIDLLIRKNLTHKNFIRYPDEQKADMYSYAMDKIFTYTVKWYDPSKGTAFNAFTTAIKNAFSDSIKDYYKLKNIASKVLRTHGQDAIAYNCDVMDNHHIENEVKNALVYFDDHEEESIIEEITDFEKEIKTLYPSVIKTKLLEDWNAPKFKRKYTEYSMVIPFNFHNGNSKRPNKGVVVDFFDLRITNEANGTRPSEINKRAIIARKNGLQYVGVFSDEWDTSPEIIKKRIAIVVDHVSNNTSFSNGRELRYDYIVESDLDFDNVFPPVWYGLKDDRSQRFSFPDQNVQLYMNWLNNEENATRVYDAARLKEIEKVPNIFTD